MCFEVGRDEGVVWRFAHEYFVSVFGFGVLFGVLFGLIFGVVAIFFIQLSPSGMSIMEVF